MSIDLKLQKDIITKTRNCRILNMNRKPDSLEKQFQEKETKKARESRNARTATKRDTARWTITQETKTKEYYYGNEKKCGDYSCGNLETARFCQISANDTPGR